MLGRRQQPKQLLCPACGGQLAVTAEGHAHCINAACPNKLQNAQQQQGNQQGLSMSITAVVLRWVKKHLFELRGNLRGFGGTGNALVAGIFSTIFLAAIAAVVLPMLPFPLIAESGVVIAGLGLAVFAMLNAERRKGGHRGLPGARRAWMTQLAVVPVTTILVFLDALKMASGTLAGTALLAVVAMTIWGRKLMQFEAHKTDLEIASLGTYQHQAEDAPVQPAVSTPVTAPSPAPAIEEDRPAFDPDGFPVDPYAQPSASKFERIPEPEPTPNIRVEEPPPAPTPEPQVNQQTEIVSHPDIEYAPEIENDSPEKVIAELEAFRGQDEAARELIRLIKGLPIQKRRAELGAEKGQLEAYNYRFEGPPGTGKSTLATFLSRALLTAEIVESPHIVKAKAKDLVGGFIGHSAHLTLSTIEQSRGGILLVDEAYKLRADDANSAGAAFKVEALDTLVEEMGEANNRLVVIFCGYPDDIQALMEMNDGLTSRFTGGAVPFRNYDAGDLAHISVEFLEQSSYHLTQDALELAEKRFVDVLNRPFAKRKDWGNARDARTICSQMTIEHRARLADLEDVSDDLLSTLDPEDVDAGFNAFINKRERSVSTEASSLLIQ